MEPCRSHHDGDEEGGGEGRVSGSVASKFFSRPPAKRDDDACAGGGCSKKIRRGDPSSVSNATDDREKAEPEPRGAAAGDGKPDLVTVTEAGQVEEKEAGAKEAGAKEAGAKEAGAKEAGAKEPLLSEAQRLTVYPIMHQDIWLLYKQQLASFWTAEEIDFSKDREQWAGPRLSDDDRHFVRCILAFFAASDSLVMLNLMDNFCKEVTVLEAQIAYTYQAMMENIHAEVYSLMIDTFFTDHAQKTAMLQSLGGLRSVQLKVDWSRRWSLRDAPFAKRLVAFAIVEGLFFSGAFCAIYWIKQRNLLPGLTKSNEFIARDEGQHTEFACLLYSKVVGRLDAEEVRGMFREAVDIEKEFINESIPCRLVGMNAELMAQYIEYVADGLLKKLGYDQPLFGAENPFDFMTLCGLPSRVNFFECRASEYQRADVLNVDRGKRDVFYMDDF
jgi:ribonucleotide reductase beta subunit family protein with ferritin-like domain